MELEKKESIRKFLWPEAGIPAQMKVEGIEARVLELGQRSRAAE